MNPETNDNQTALTGAEKNARERMKFVDFWADYVRNHPDRDWSSQQKLLIDSQIQGARSWGWTPEAFMRMKGEKLPAQLQKTE